MPAQSVRRPLRGAPTLLALLSFIIVVAAACTGAGASPSAPPSATASATPAVLPSPTAVPSPTSFAVVTDDEGAVVEIATEPQRIVSLTPATTEILFAIGAGPRVIATTDFDDYPPEAIDLPDVASFQAVDVEKIVGLETDLVIAGGNFFNDPAAIAQLRDLGIPVVVTYAPTIEGVLHDIELIGTAVGLEQAAADLRSSMQAGFDEVSAAVTGLDRPRTFYELDATNAIYTAADESFLAEMIELAGGDPITTGSTTDFAIPIENLVTADPQVILLGDAAYGVTPEAVVDRPGWAVMTAVKDGAIRAVDDVVITRPGPRLVDGLRALALAIHPDAPVPAASPAAP
jgi:iron complex transport system substrate-binding protein